MRHVTVMALILSLACASALAAPAGQALVESKCVVCHSQDRIKAAKKDRAAWEATVTRMFGNGAKIGADEKSAIVEYLSTGK